MRGRKKLPTGIKAVRGTLRKDRENPNEPKPDLVKSAHCPYKLVGRAVDAWNEFATQLESMRVLTEGDLQGLKLLCESVAEYDSLYTRLWIKQANGNVEYVPTQNFYQIYEPGRKKKLTVPILLSTKLKPEVKLIAENRKFVKSMLAEFGLTPSSRAKVSSGLPQGGGRKLTRLEELREARAKRKRNKNNAS